MTLIVAAAVGIAVGVAVWSAATLMLFWYDLGASVEEE